MYVDLRKVTLDKVAMEEETKNRQTSVLSAEESAELFETVRKEFLATWVLQRITHDASSGTLGMKKLFGDNYEEASPTVPEDPLVAAAVPMASVRSKVDVEQFAKITGDVRSSMAELSVDNQAARKMAQRLSISIDAFAGMHKAASQGSVRNKYVWAFLRWIRKKQVAEMTAVLENSAVYANILKKEAEERAAESA